MEAQSTSYTSKSIKNVLITVIFEAVSLVLMFVVRFIFLNKLSIETLAVDSMMKTIIGYVAFADLGVTSIMTFFLFKPIKENDEDHIKAILKFYKHIFLGIIGLTVVLGTIFAFLLPVLFDETVGTSYKLYIVYFLFILNLIFTYLFASKKTFLIADQKSYIANGIVLIFQIAQSVVQIVILLVVKNYYVFLIVPCAMTILGAICIDIYCKKNYAFLNETTTEKLSKDEQKRFYKKIGDIIFFRIGTLLFNFTDNIIISLMLSTIMVGYASNYVLITSAATTILLTAINSLIGTIGAITTSEDKEKAYQRYLKINDVAFIIFLFAALCIYGLSSPFINLVYGTKYVLEPEIAFALSLSFFITGINQTNSLFRSGFGLFKEARFIPIACGVLNIVLSVLLCLNMKLFGIYLATSIAKVLTFNTFDTLLLHSKKAFSKKVWKRYILLAVQICCFLIGALLLTQVMNLNFDSMNFVKFLICIILCISLVLPICIIYLMCSPILVSVMNENVIPILKGTKKKWFVQKNKKE